MLNDRIQVLIDAQTVLPHDAKVGVKLWNLFYVDHDTTQSKAVRFHRKFVDRVPPMAVNGERAVLRGDTGVGARRVNSDGLGISIVRLTQALWQITR
jgi:hypothetical protein